jgi:ATP-dependent Clp protease protease subunit
MSRYYSLYTEESGSELHIYGDITSGGGWFSSESDVSSYQIAKELSELDTSKPLTVYINSYGGEVGEGLAIYNQLKRFEKCKTVVDGFAASIASVIFMAGKERVMSPSSLLFIHNAWTYAQGNSDELRKTADDLEKITSASISAYMEHISIDEDKLKEMLGAETWISADEAVEMGFATEKAKSTESDKPSQSVRSKIAKMLLETAAPETPPPPPEDTPMQKFFKSIANRKDD